jgi:hypothetical protein
MISGWGIATKAALGYSTLAFTGTGANLATQAIDPTGDIANRVVDGGASVVMMSVAAAAIYSLLRGHIVPMATFEHRLKSIEKSICDAAASARTGAEALQAHAKETAEASKRVESAVHELVHEIRTWKD